MAARGRLDAELVRRKLAQSRTAAQALIASGAVTVSGVTVPKPASQVTRDQPISVADDGPSYASRGGLKLAGALDELGLDPGGLVALDAGCAHGGFTDVLLRRGAAHVVAVDVAYGQLAWSLRNDSRVTLLERTNVRHLTPEQLGGHRPQLVVADLSFISLRKVLRALTAVSAPDAVLAPMVKPQFELTPGAVGKGGVVRDPEGWATAMRSVADAARDLGWFLHGAVASQAPGPAGNVEFFLDLRRRVPDDGEDAGAAAIVQATQSGVALRRR